MRQTLLALALPLLLAACAKPEPPQAPAYRGMIMTPPLAKPDFTFTSMSGAPYRFREETNDKVTLLFFGYTHCPDVCPMHMANIAAVLRKMPAADRERVKVVFVTTDPQRDTPERLRTWLGNFDSTFVGVEGRMEDVNRLQQSMGMPPAAREDVPTGSPAGAYGIAHGSAVLAFTADDSLRTVYPFGMRQEDFAIDIPLLLKVAPK
jgi:protein SCO1/2